MGAALPLAPLVPVMVYAEPLETIPPEAKRLYLKRTCDLMEAGEFLGFRPKTDPQTGEVVGPSNAVYNRVKAYKDRTDPVKSHPPFDPNELLPGDGEIAAVKTATWVVDTHKLVWQVYGQVSPW